MEKVRVFNLEDRLINFAIDITDVAETLPDTKVCNHLSYQLIRSSTSTALNYGEAQAAESKKDFIHKMKVILKELRETSICLRILIGKSLISSDELTENRELIAIFTKSITTAETNLLK